VGIDKLLAHPEQYVGSQLVLRGHFILEHVETIVLLEPVNRQSHVRLSIKSLPAPSTEQLLACRSKLVDVQGYVTYAHMRGGEALIVLANAMVDAQAGTHPRRGDAK
jgi:hypothetical protein